MHIIDDQQDEEDKTIELRLTDARNAVLGGLAQVTLAIVDDDTITPSLDISRR